MKSQPGTPSPEFSRPLAVDKIPPSGSTEILEANANQRTALAKRFDLMELPAFKATFHVELKSAGAVMVTGHVTADVVQRCIVTLEPLPSHIESAVDVVFIPPAVDDEPDLDLEEGEVEPIVNGIIDLGELAAQHLGVALDPYPRKPGATFGEVEYGDSRKQDNAFVRLAELSKKPKDKA